MTTATDKLKLAALEFADANRAINEFEGDRKGPAFEAACATWRAATTALTKAAKASGEDQRRAAETEQAREDA